MRDNVLLGSIKSGQDGVCSQIDLITIDVPEIKHTGVTLLLNAEPEFVNNKLIKKS